MMRAATDPRVGAAADEHRDDWQVADDHTAPAEPRNLDQVRALSARIRRRLKACSPAARAAYLELLRACQEGPPGEVTVNVYAVVDSRIVCAACGDRFVPRRPHHRLCEKCGQAWRRYRWRS